MGQKTVGIMGHPGDSRDGISGGSIAARLSRIQGMPLSHFLKHLFFISEAFTRPQHLASYYTSPNIFLLFSPCYPFTFHLPALFMPCILSSLIETNYKRPNSIPSDEISTLKNNKKKTNYK